MKGMPQGRSSSRMTQKAQRSFQLCARMIHLAVHLLPVPTHSESVHFEDGHAGVLAARAASTVTGRASEDTGIRIESIIKAGLTGPMAEALAMYYQVRGLPQQTSTRLMLLPI